MNHSLARSLRIPRRLKKEFHIRWNRVVFRANGIKFGKGMQVYCRVHVNTARGSRVVIGDNFTFTSGHGFNPICRNIEGSIYTQCPGARITIGDNTGMSSTSLWAKKSITIGSNVKIGGDCIVMDTDCHSLDHIVRRSTEVDENGMGIDGLAAHSAPIVIEDDVLVGARSIVLKGVTIGARSVIGAGSVVTRSIPADCIAAGNPCRVVASVPGAAKR